MIHRKLFCRSFLFSLGLFAVVLSKAVDENSGDLYPFDDTEQTDPVYDYDDFFLYDDDVESNFDRDSSYYYDPLGIGKLEDKNEGLGFYDEKDMDDQQKEEETEKKQKKNEEEDIDEDLTENENDEDTNPTENEDDETGIDGFKTQEEDDDDDDDYEIDDEEDGLSKSEDYLIDGTEENKSDADNESDEENESDEMFENSLPRSYPLLIGGFVGGTAVIIVLAILAIVIVIYIVCKRRPRQRGFLRISSLERSDSNLERSDSHSNIYIKKAALDEEKNFRI